MCFSKNIFCLGKRYVAIVIEGWMIQREWSSRKKKSGKDSSFDKGEEWTISRTIIFFFIRLYRSFDSCLSSTTGNIDKRQSYIQRKMFLVESGKINVSQRSYLGYSFVAMRWLISSFENCELKRLLKFENEVLQNEIQCIWYITESAMWSNSNVLVFKKKKKKSIARLKKHAKNFSNSIFEIRIKKIRRRESYFND